MAMDAVLMDAGITEGLYCTWVQFPAHSVWGKVLAGAYAYHTLRSRLIVSHHPFGILL